MKKYLLIIFSVFIIFMCGCSKQQKNWYEEIGETKIYGVVKRFLKEQVNYPETFEFTEYPNFTYGTEKERLVKVDGEFKSANIFGVYKYHEFTITIQITHEWVVKYYEIY